jgi:hypothetical protein
MLTMENTKTKSKSGTVATRMSNDELERFRKLVAQAKRRNHLSDKASVARELMGFDAVPQTVTDEDRQYLVYGRVEPEEVSPGQLTRKHQILIRKVKDILLYGESDNPDENWAVAIRGNINAMWVCLKRGGRPKARTGQKTHAARKRKDDRSNQIAQNNEVELPVAGDRAAPG